MEDHNDNVKQFVSRLNKNDGGGCSKLVNICGTLFLDVVGQVLESLQDACAAHC
jgi:hypothetical protein